MGSAARGGEEEEAAFGRGLWRCRGCDCVAAHSQTWGLSDLSLLKLQLIVVKLSPLPTIKKDVNWKGTALLIKTLCIYI